MTTQQAPLLTSQSRLWITENGAGPGNPPVYQGRARATQPTISAGQLTAIREPSVSQYGQFVTVGVQRGAPDLPTVTFESRNDPTTISQFLRLMNRRCEFDAQVHFGNCQDPQDFTNGWDFVRIFEQIEPSNWAGGDQGAFDESQEAVMVETLDVAAQRIYDVKTLRAGEVASTEITDEVVDVLICDSVTCGQCGRTSDGCQIVFILVGGTAGSPGLAAELIYSQDGGSTWGTTNITTLSVAEAPSAMHCVGTNLVIVSNDSGSLHYASINDILDGTESWSEATSGFDASGPPNAITSVARDRTWIAGDGGRIYSATDPTSGVTEQADGSQTSEDLTAIHALDRNNVVAVGANNAVLATANAGQTWTLVVGPAAGVALTAVVMRSVNEWIVGTAGGELWYTTNGGSTWAQKGFPGSGGGSVTALSFASRSVGYMAHELSGVGRVLRTIDGGFSWVLMPEEAGQTLPDNDRINALAPCVDDPNVVFAAGLGANGSDGFAVKFS